MGLTSTAGNPRAAEPQAAVAPGNMDALLSDMRSAVDSGGSVIVTVTGHTDAQHRNSNNGTLAEHRAFITAWSISDNLGRPVSVVPDASMCGGGACVVYTAHEGARSNSDLGRFSSATATFSPPPPPAPLPAVAGGGLLGNISLPAPAPSFRPDLPPVWWPSIPSTPPVPGPGGGPAVVPAPVPVFPDPFDPRTGEVRVVVEVPDTLRVGGSLSVHELRVVSVEVLCDGEVCDRVDAPVVDVFDGRLELDASSSRFSSCVAASSTGCDFFAVPSTVRVRTDELIGRPLSMRFFSPTPAGVSVLPTLVVDRLTVRQAVPVWVGGDTPWLRGVCEADPATPDCWDVLMGAELDLAVSVVTTDGEPLQGSGARYFLRRSVIGSVGS
jgi:hypothetical protein